MLILLALICTTVSGIWAYREKQKEKNQRGLIVVGGITLATIATIVTIVSAIVSIIVGLCTLFDDHLWWMLH
tara:strand:+ start:625 stop:840 length:216 start_codon:yes stop_codon:yes gene_type:complete